ncbi:MAG: M20 family metallopeptidase [Lachnospiraceae bacterium]
MITKNAICDIVEKRKNEAIEYLTKALEIPSPTGYEKEIGVQMAKWIDEIGLESEIREYSEGRPNIIAEWKGHKQGKRFLLNGHLDVFPATVDSNGETKAWKAQVENGYIFGRGAVDMKGGNIAGLMAVKWLKEMGFIPNGTIILSYVSDEEAGGKFGTLQLLKEGFLKADIGISMEQTNNNIVVAAGGIHTCKIVIHGDGGMAFHVMNETGNEGRYGGENAIQKSVKALNALFRLSDKILKEKAPDECGISHMSITNIHAGEATNTHPRIAEIIIDRRYLPGETPESVKKEIIEALEEVKKDDEFFEYEYHADYEPPAPVFSIDEDSEIIRALDKVIGELRGTEAKHIKQMGCGEACYIKDETGCEIPLCGPGRHEDGMAAEDERLSIEEFLLSIKIYMMTIVEIMG